jgi:hypothetical protein
MRVARACMRKQESKQRIGRKGDSNKINIWADAHGKMKESPRSTFKMVSSFKDERMRQVCEAV